MKTEKSKTEAGNKNVLVINPISEIEKLKALASLPRINILNLLRNSKININEISAKLKLPQSTVATHVSILEDAGLVNVEIVKAKKGNQKICSASFSELIVKFPEENTQDKNVIEVEMPVGIFTDCKVSSPCGLCSCEKIIGHLDSTFSFLEPERFKAGLLWCGSGTFEYKFPNNALYEKRPLKKIEVSVELSSETPGTNLNWPSDICVWINNVEPGFWTSPGDFGDKRGIYTPLWWRLEGSQYGILKHFYVTEEGSFADGEKLSNVTLKDLKLSEHHSVKFKIGVKENAVNAGGMNIFGKGFGNTNQGIIMKFYF